jgi:hypothetical protein
VSNVFFIMLSSIRTDEFIKSDTKHSSFATCTRPNDVRSGTEGRKIQYQRNNDFIQFYLLSIFLNYHMNNMNFTNIYHYDTISLY